MNGFKSIQVDGVSEALLWFCGIRCSSFISHTNEDSGHTAYVNFFNYLPSWCFNINCIIFTLFPTCINTAKYLWQNKFWSVTFYAELFTLSWINVSHVIAWITLLRRKCGPFAQSKHKHTRMGSRGCRGKMDMKKKDPSTQHHFYTRFRQAKSPFNLVLKMGFF